MTTPLSPATVPPATAAGNSLGAKAPGAFYSDAAEALTNAGLGLVVSWLASWLVLGFTPVQAIGVTALFFCLSTARSYALRRLFRRWG